MVESRENPIKKEKPGYLRMPVSVEIGGKKEQIWVRYKIREKELTAKCIECGKEDSQMIQEACAIEAESDNEEIIKLANEKIKELVEKVEREMFVCKGHYTQEFKNNRPGLYAEKLRKVQKDLGVKVPDDQEERIKNQIHMD